MSYIADQLRTYLPWAPPWAIGLMVIALALALAIGLHALIVRGLARGLRRRSDFTRSLVVRTEGPGRLALIVIALGSAVQVAPLPPRETVIVQHGLLIAFIVLVGWMVRTGVDIASALYMRRQRTDAADNFQARKMLTQVRILRRATNVLIILLTVGAALTTLPGVKQVGVSLLAAGGAAGIIVGLALQPILSNIMAGIQIAFTQPIRIDDAVVIQDEFGNIEEINSTYVVVRLWDQRRLVVPLKFFLEQPFQNWTRESARLIGHVLLLVDQRLPIDDLRAKVEEIVGASPLWDGELVKVQVTDVRERTLEVRCLVSARNAGEAFDLRAEIREKIIGWLQVEHPQALPQHLALPETEPQ